MQVPTEAYELKDIPDLKKVTRKVSEQMVVRFLTLFQKLHMRKET